MPGDVQQESAAEPGCPTAPCVPLQGHCSRFTFWVTAPVASGTLRQHRAVPKLAAWCYLSVPVLPDVTEHLVAPVAFPGSAPHHQQAGTGSYGVQWGV